MPGHQIVGINCSYMAGSGGAIHCIVMQIPASAFLHVKHYPLPDSTTDTLNDYRVRAELTTSSNLETDSTVVFYKIGSSLPFTATPLAAVGDTPGVYAGYIPAQSAGDTVFYFLLAKNIEDIRRTAPTHCPPHIHSFRIAGSVGVNKGQEKIFLPQLSVFPNPAREKVTFSFQAEEKITLCIELFNILGQRVKKVEKQQLLSGTNNISLRLDDKTGKALPQGIYFYSVRLAGCVYQDKILVIR
jgi:hypothetical protein